MKKSRDFGWTFVSSMCVEGTDGTVVISILGGTHGYAVCCMSVECKKVDISHPGARAEGSSQVYSPDPLSGMQGVLEPRAPVPRSR